MILLDTNVVSEPMRRNPDRKVLEWLDAQMVETLYLASISLAELLLGIESLPAGKRRKALAATLDRQLLTFFGGRLLAFDTPAAELYPRIVISARRRGYAIGVPDAQIAAIAASHRFFVATRDLAPFQAAGVSTIDPWSAL